MPEACHSEACTFTGRDASPVSEWHLSVAIVDGFLFTFRVKKGETHFFFCEKKKRFSISKKKRQGGFSQSRPLWNPLLNRKGKPHMYQRGVQILFVVPKLRYYAHEGAQLPSSLSSYNQRDHAVERVSSAVRRLEDRAKRQISRFTKGG